MQFPHFDTVGMHRDLLTVGREQLHGLAQISDLHDEDSTDIQVSVQTIIDPLVARLPGFIALRCAMVGAASVNRADRTAVHESLKQHKHLLAIPPVLVQMLSSTDDAAEPAAPLPAAASVPSDNAM